MDYFLATQCGFQDQQHYHNLGAYVFQGLGFHLRSAVSESTSQQNNYASQAY